MRVVSIVDAPPRINSQTALKPRTTCSGSLRLSTAPRSSLSFPIARRIAASMGATRSSRSSMKLGALPAGSTSDGSELQLVVPVIPTPHEPP